MVPKRKAHSSPLGNTKGKKVHQKNDTKTVSDTSEEKKSEKIDKGKVILKENCLEKSLPKINLEMFTPEPIKKERMNIKNDSPVLELNQLL